MAAAPTLLRQAVGTVIGTEFAAEGIVVRPDKLHESLGQGTPIAGSYPEGERPHASGIVATTVITVQVFMAWDPQIDPTQAVDPALIEAWSWRFQRAVKTAAMPNVQNLSYYNVAEILYPDDPTGNKTRFYATVIGYGANPSIGETTG
jgi:hypothetical protein